MSGEPVITVVGNLVADPELRFTQSGKAVCSARLANTPRTKKNDQWVDGTTLWLSLTMWDQFAENCAETLRKGMKVVVVGRLTQREYTTKEGDNRISMEIQVDNIGPDLRNATATVNKVQRSGGQQGGYGQQAPADDPWMTPGPVNGQSQQQAAPWAGQQQAPQYGQPQQQYAQPQGYPTQNPYPPPPPRQQQAQAPLPLDQWNTPFPGDAPQQGYPPQGPQYAQAPAPQMPAQPAQRPVAAPTREESFNANEPPF